MNRTGSTTYVMVHSAWLGGWAWGSVAPLLEKHGHKVIAPDLPGHGQDKTPPEKVTLDSYVKTVTDVLDSQETPVILVGHSLGGIIISQPPSPTCKSRWRSWSRRGIALPGSAVTAEPTRASSWAYLEPGVC